MRKLQTTLSLLVESGSTVLEQVPTSPAAPDVVVTGDRISQDMMASNHSQPLQDRRRSSSSSKGVVANSPVSMTFMFASPKQ
jgi:hypothetical protein